jgi:hypothetical protein
MLKRDRGTCWRKFRFEGRKAAEAEIARLVSIKAVVFGELRVWFCGHCLGHHIGHKRCSQRGKVASGRKAV